MGLCMRVLYGGKGWTVAFPREPVLQQTTEGLLEDMMAVNASNISVYTCDAAAFVRYLSEPPVNAAHKAKQDRYAHFLRNLGPIPCGGSRIDRGLIREAIPLGIQIKVSLTCADEEKKKNCPADLWTRLWFSPLLAPQNPALS